MLGPELLCFRCEDDGWSTCFFVRIAQLIAEDTSLAKDDQRYAILREKIRAEDNRGCPHARLINPDSAS